MIACGTDIPDWFVFLHFIYVRFFARVPVFFVRFFAYLTTCIAATCIQMHKSYHCDDANGSGGRVFLGGG